MSGPLTPLDLTDRQRDVAQLITAGLSTKQIAVSLGVSQSRVRVIVSSIAYRIGADPSLDERVQVALWWAGLALRPAA